VTTVVTANWRDAGWKLAGYTVLATLAMLSYSLLGGRGADSYMELSFVICERRSSTQGSIAQLWSRDSTSA